MKDFDQSSAESREMANSFQSLKGGDSWTTTVSAPTRSNGSCGSKSVHSDVSFIDAKASECGSTLKVHDYIGLSEVSSHPSDDDLRASDDCNLNFGETELKLGLSLTAAPAGFQCKDVALGRAPGPFQDTNIADEYSPGLSNACLSRETFYRTPPRWVPHQDRGSLLYSPMKVPEMRGGGDEYQCSGVWSRGSEHWVSQDSRFNVEKSADVSSPQNSFCPRGFAERDFQAPAGQNVDGVRPGFGMPVSGFSGCKPVITAKNTMAGTKRGYIQAIGSAKANPAVQFSEKQHCPSFVNWNLGSRRSSYPSGMNITMTDLGIDSRLVSWDGLKASGQENAEQRPGNDRVDDQSALAEDSSTSPKSPVVGWPPIRSYRKNTLAAHPRCPEDEQEVVEAGNFLPNQGNSFYVKVNMEGVPIGRKVDLNAYNTYETLALALEDMFQLSTSCENGTQIQHNASTASKLSKLLDGSSDYILTHEDKEGDWMLVGDVPWGMFVNTVKRLRIVKTAEANGIAPTCPEHVQNRQKSQAT